MIRLMRHPYNKELKRIYYRDSEVTKLGNAEAWSEYYSFKEQILDYPTRVGIIADLKQGIDNFKAEQLG